MSVMIDGTLVFRLVSIDGLSSVMNSGIVVVTDCVCLFICMYIFIHIFFCRWGPGGEGQTTKACVALSGQKETFQRPCLFSLGQYTRNFPSKCLFYSSVWDGQWDTFQIVHPSSPLFQNVEVKREFQYANWKGRSVFQSKGVSAFIFQISSSG